MKMSSVQKKVLSKLIDQYENSVTFTGKNKIRQSFAINVGKTFPGYQDDSDYDFYSSFNEDIKEMAARGWVEISEKHRRIDKIILIQDSLEGIYEALGRRPRKDIQSGMLELFEHLEESIYNRPEGEGSEQYEELKGIYLDYINKQKKRIEENKSVEFFSGDMDEYRDIWKIMLALFDLKEDVFVRDLSVRLFHDSKRLEKLIDKTGRIFYEFGEFPEKDHILEEYGIIRIPSHVCVKGNIELVFGDERISMRNIPGDIGLSGDMLNVLSDLVIHGKRIVTIENQTAFYRYDCGDEDAAVYLAGYHGRQKRDFLRKIYSEYPHLEYCHFGDIDAGGFYIYEHLRRKTGIPFKTMKMDADILLKHREFTKKLTDNDKKRIQNLIGYYKSKPDPDEQILKNLETLQTMLENNIKLEQEAVY